MKLLGPKPAKGAAIVVVVILLLGLLAPWIAPFGYDDQNTDLIFSAPSFLNWFGTDALGRDLLSRLLYGSTVSMSVAVITALSSVIFGTLYGTVAGYAGGWLERIMVRVIDILYTLPALIVIILVMLIFDQDLIGLFIALTFTGWLGTARLMRAQVKSWKHRPFVEAARALGMNPFRLVFRHIVPNCIGPIIVELSYQIPTNVLAEAFLSFLGIGIRPPRPSWGVLAKEGWEALGVHPHLIVFPGLCIFITMLAFNVLGDHLRDKLDPVLRGR